VDTDDGAPATVHGTDIPPPTRTTNHKSTAAPTKTARSATRLRAGRDATPGLGNVPTTLMRK